MKKTIRILSLCLSVLFPVLLFASCGQGAGSEIPSGFVKASIDEACAYEMFVPENWTVSSGSAADFTMATVSGTDPCNVSMAVVDSVQAETVAAYWEEQQAEYAAIFGTITPDEENQGSKVEIGGTFGYRYQFNASYNGKDYRFMQIYIPHREGLILSATKLYIFTYTAQAEHFDDHYANTAGRDVAHIIEYFKFK